MKKTIALSLLFFTSLIVSCEKNEDNQNNLGNIGNDETIEYYVEYQASYSNSHHRSTTISYITPEGLKTTPMSSGQHFSVTVGPFKKGDRTYVSGEIPTTGYTSSARSAILVKKGDAPFVQKAESTTSMTCSFTINF